MPRLQNRVTGVVVNVDDATAKMLGPGWVPVGQETAKRSTTAPATKPNKD